MIFSIFVLRTKLRLAKAPCYSKRLWLHGLHKADLARPSQTYEKAQIKLGWFWRHSLARQGKSSKEKEATNFLGMNSSCKKVAKNVNNYTCKYFLLLRTCLLFLEMINTFRIIPSDSMTLVRMEKEEKYQIIQWQAVDQRKSKLFSDVCSLFSFFFYNV